MGLVFGWQLVVICCWFLVGEWLFVIGFSWIVYFALIKKHPYYPFKGMRKILDASLTFEYNCHSE